MPHIDSDHNLDVLAAQDFNVQTQAAQKTGTANPPIPEDHRPTTPEFLQELMDMVTKLRQRDSEIWADMYPMVKPGQVPKEPPYERREQYKRESEEIQKQIAACQYRIQELRILIAAKPPIQPESEKHPAPTQPDFGPEVQSELQKGPSLPLQRPKESYDEIHVHHSAHFGEAPPVRK